MEQTLLLNITYEPLRVISWKKAITLMCLDKVEMVEQYERYIHGVSLSVPLPAVVRLLSRVKRLRQEVTFSKKNVYLRDQGQCQYCGRPLQPKEITYDHVIPRSQGGSTSWENVVTSCVHCNGKKGGRTPKQAQMRLLTAPRRPEWHHFMRVTIVGKPIPESWSNYLYWRSN